jgi:ribulose-phosphate 3-epimerase
MEIIPAILPKSIDDLTEKLSQVKDLVPKVQIDVVDGKFAGTPGWPFVGDDGYFEKVLGEEEGLPFWEDIDFEADLMVKDVDRAIEQWCVAGASSIVIHADLAKQEETIRLIGAVKDRGVEPVLAVGIDDDTELLAPYVSHLDRVQCMGIRRIGFQGEAFDEKVIEQIKRIKRQFPELHISVDGGVNQENAPQLAEAGAETLVVGSILFNKNDADYGKDEGSIKNVLEELKSL